MNRLTGADVAGFLEELYQSSEDKDLMLSSYGLTKCVDFVIDMTKCNEVEPMLFDYIIEYPLTAKKIMSDVLHSHYPEDMKCNITINNIPSQYHTELSKVGKHQLGKLVALNCIVKRVSDAQSKITGAKFVCAKCGNIERIVQPDLIVRYPVECNTKGCGGKWELVEDESEYTTYQRIDVQESPEQLRGGRQPTSIYTYCYDPLVGKIAPGMRVVLNGVIELDRTKEKLDSPIVGIRMQIDSFQAKQEDFDELVISAKDEEDILQLSNNPAVYDILVKHIAPSIMGYDEFKEAMLLQLFGGTTKILEDGSVIRGDIHLFICGDPGVAKSKMIEAEVDLSPKGMFTSGKGSSGVGLTAAVVKDQIKKDAWALEVGPLVLCVGGILAIDEMDKMTKEDRSALHEAMESGHFTIAKAGITATMSAKTSIIGAANPKYERFEDDEPYVDQLPLEIALLSRFDLIFIERDRPNKEKDRAICDKILDNHRKGQMIKNNMVFGRELSLSKEFIRKYVAKGKKVNPMLSDEAAKILADNYDILRSKGGRIGKTVSITPRQLDAYVRLSEASARVRLSDVITADDAYRAIRLVSNTLNKISPDGDIDVVMTGVSRKKHDMVREMKEILKSMCKETMKRENLILNMTDKGYTESEVDKTIDLMHERGDVIYPRYGEVQYVGF